VCSLEGYLAKASSLRGPLAQSPPGEQPQVRSLAELQPAQLAWERRAQLRPAPAREPQASVSQPRAQAPLEQQPDGSGPPSLPRPSPLSPP
jgi:hypothetical protein